MWFDRFLKGQLNGIDTRPRIELAPDPWRAPDVPGGVSAGAQGSPADVPRPPDDRRARRQGTHRGVPTWRFNETFGHALVSVKASTPTGWSFNAVLSAITPKGGEIVVSQGGVPTTTLRSTTRNSPSAC